MLIKHINCTVVQLLSNKLCSCVKCGKSTCLLVQYILLRFQWIYYLPNHQDENIKTDKHSDLNKKMMVFYLKRKELNKP